MDEELRRSEVLHAVTNDIFQRVLDFGPQFREFLTQAKQYHKALLGASVAANSFYQGFMKIAHLGSEAKDSNKLLGKGICDIVAVYKQMENQANNVLKTLSQDFIIPLEEWAEKEMSRVKTRQKVYNQENKTAFEAVEKSRGDLIKVRKKSQRSKTSVKYEQKEQQIMSAHEQFQQKLDKLRIAGCHEAMNIQRNVFSFVVEKSFAVSKAEYIHHEEASQLLNSRLPIWDSLIKKPLSLQVNISSLLKQLTENDHYGKSLDEHISGSESPSVPQSGPSSEPIVHMPPKAPVFDISNKRLSHQFSVGATTMKKQLDQPDGPEKKVKLQALYVHNASDATQLSFQPGDVISAGTSVTAGWQYGENTKTQKSGWFPVAFAEEVMAVQTSANPSNTLPASTNSNPRPSVIPTVNGMNYPPTPHIPDPDYETNHVTSSRLESRTPASPKSVISPIHKILEVDEPPPPPPPQLQTTLDGESSAPFPPPPPPLPPPIGGLTGSFDQSL